MKRVNNLNFLTEFQAAEGSHSATEALSGGVNVSALGSPAVLQANGIAGYAKCSVAGGIGTGTDCFGGYFQAHAAANNAIVFGANQVVFDNSGLTNWTVIGK
jgi:hypothetical protein